MREIENLKQQILKEYPRLNKDSKFCFECHPKVPCFNECCGDVNIFLTPYDIIRLKQNLGISSTELLKKYTISPFDQNLKYPVILLQMDPKSNKCPFVTEKGCGVYEDRPWACRMYPLGLATPGDDSDELDEEFYFLLKESVCKGFEENREISISQWLDDQGIDEYNEMGMEFKELTTHKYLMDGGELTPDRVEMFFLACYDIDRFRKFVFGTSFLKKFDVDEKALARMKEDDLEMLRFGYQWLKFALYGAKTIVMKDDVVTTKKKELVAKGKLSRDNSPD